MKITIDIPEDVYTRLFDNGIQDNEISVNDVCEMARVIRKGIPLKAIEQNTCEDPKLISVRQELLDRGDETVSFRQLVERFDEVEEAFNGIPWNLKQIYSNFNILIGEKPCTDAISRQAYDKGFDDGLEEGLKVGACEDCIDRQYLVDKATSWDKHFTDSERYVSLTDIQNAPPVTPAEKMGHWEWVQYDYNPKLGDWHCSECRSVVVECVDKNEKGGIPMYKYCPQCGIKMKEVVE